MWLYLATDPLHGRPLDYSLSNIANMHPRDSLDIGITTASYSWASYVESKNNNLTRSREDNLKMNYSLVRQLWVCGQNTDAELRGWTAWPLYVVSVHLSSPGQWGLPIPGAPDPFSNTLSVFSSSSLLWALGNFSLSLLWSKLMSVLAT